MDLAPVFTHYQEMLDEDQDLREVLLEAYNIYRLVIDLKFEW